MIVFKQLADQSEGDRRAEWLVELGRRLARLQRLEEALTATQEAVTIYQDLALTDDDRFLPQLAKSLNGKSIRLFQLGRLDEALDTIKMAINICRDLVQSASDEHLLELAKYLNNGSLYLAEMERLRDGWIFIEESVAIYRDLGSDRSGLAMSLHSMSRYLAERGKLGEALNVMAKRYKYTEIWRMIDPICFSPISHLLNNQSMRMARLGRPLEAPVVIEGVTGVERDLVRDHPRPFLPDMRPSPVTSSDGKQWSDSSMHAIEEAVNIYSKLARDRPEVFLPTMLML